MARLAAPRLLTVRETAERLAVSQYAGAVHRERCFEEDWVATDQLRIGVIRKVEHALHRPANLLRLNSANDVDCRMVTSVAHCVMDFGEHEDHSQHDRRRRRDVQRRSRVHRRAVWNTSADAI